MQDSDSKTFFSMTVADVREKMMRSGFISEWLSADLYIQKWWSSVLAEKQPEPSQGSQLELFSAEAMSGKEKIVVKAPLVDISSAAMTPSS